MTSIDYPADTIKVWDPVLRIFHWSLVLFFSLAFITEDDWLSLHVVAGYAITLLIAFRILWGLIGPRYARFTQFIKSPAEVVSYIGKMLRFKIPHYLGHNPAAAAMIVSLLLSIILLCFSGMIIIAAEGQGPLANTFFSALNAEWIEEIHEFFANFTLLLVILHVVGVLFSSLLEGQNLVRAMITGRKKQVNNAVDQ
jgi:cytochrome b